MKRHLFREVIAMMLAVMLCVNFPSVHAFAAPDNEETTSVSDGDALTTSGGDSEEAGTETDTVDDTVRILMVGNSLTRYNDVAGKLEKLFAYAGIEACVDTRTQMGASLFDQADILAASTRAAIVEGDYDYVVLQEKSSGFTEALLRQGVDAFMPWIEEAPSQPRLVLYMPWSNEDVFESMQTVFTEAYVAVAQENGALLAPSGEAYYDLYFNEGKHWYRNGDNVHGNDLASLISASSIFYAMQGSEQPLLQFSAEDASVVQALVESADFRNNRITYDTATVNLVEQKAYQYAGIYRDLSNVPDVSGRGVVDGSNLALQKQGSASSNARGSSAGVGARNVGNLTDGNYGSFIVLHQEDPDPWFAVDLGTAKTFNQVTLYFGATGDYSDSYRAEFVLEGTNDLNAGYTVIASSSNASTDAKVVRFDTVNYRYVRVHVTNVIGAYVSLYEMEVANAPEPDPSEEPEEPEEPVSVCPGDFLQVCVGDDITNMSLYEQGMYEANVTFPAGVEDYAILCNGETIYEGSINAGSSAFDLLIRYFATTNSVVTGQDEHEDANGNPVQDIKKIANWTGNFFNRNGVEEFKEFGGWDQTNPLSTLEYLGGGVFAREFTYTLPANSITYQYKVNFDRVWSNGEVPSENKRVTFSGGEGTGTYVLWVNSVTQSIFDSFSDGTTVFALNGGETYEAAIGTADVSVVLTLGESIEDLEMIQTASNAYMITAFVAPGTYSYKNVIDDQDGAFEGNFTVTEDTAVTFFYRAGGENEVMLNTVENSEGFYEATAYADNTAEEPSEEPSEEPASEPSVPSTPAKETTPATTPAAASTAAVSAAPAISVPASINWTEVQTRVKAKVAEAAAHPENGNLNISAAASTVIPANVVELLKGTNATLAFHSGNGTALSVSGQDIKGNVGALDLTMTDTSSNIPAALISAKKAAVNKQISVKDTGAFLFNVNMHMALGKENAGKNANLYRYNATDNKLDYCGSFKIVESGNALFGLKRGGDYLVTVTDGKVNEKVTFSGSTYTVVKGDSMSKIARKLHMTLSKLAGMNPQVTNISKIKIGQILQVQ
ncbi:MAG: discoidin domain-containing protein [Acetatifactor sp.]|nr:discoidin domain-containing protein [Acetatifactor sp.]